MSSFHLTLQWKRACQPDSAFLEHHLWYFQCSEAIQTLWCNYYYYRHVPRFSPSTSVYLRNWNLVGVLANSWMRPPGTGSGDPWASTAATSLLPPTGHRKSSRSAGIEELGGAGLVSWVNAPVLLRELTCSSCLWFFFIHRRRPWYWHLPEVWDYKRCVRLSFRSRAHFTLNLHWLRYWSNSVVVFRLNLSFQSTPRKPVAFPHSFEDLILLSSSQTLFPSFEVSRYFSPNFPEAFCGFDLGQLCAPCEA